MTRTESCPICHGTHLTIQSDDRQIRSRDGVELPYSAHFSRCAQCGEEFFTRSQSRAASKAAAAALRQHAGLLTPDEILAIRAKYGVTQIELERILKLGKKSVVRWESGTVCQSRTADRLLREVRDSPNLFNRLSAEAGVSVAVCSEWTDAQWVVQRSVSVNVKVGKASKKKHRSRCSGIYRIIDRHSLVTRSPATTGQVVTRGDDAHTSLRPPLVCELA